MVVGVEWFYIVTHISYKYMYVCIPLFSSLSLFPTPVSSRRGIFLLPSILVPLSLSLSLSHISTPFIYLFIYFSFEFAFAFWESVLKQGLLFGLRWLGCAGLAQHWWVDLSLSTPCTYLSRVLWCFDLFSCFSIFSPTLMISSKSRQPRCWRSLHTSMHQTPVPISHGCTYVSIRIPLYITCTYNR